MMRRIIGLCLVLMIFGVTACESKKDEEKDTTPKAESKVAEVRPEKEPEGELAQKQPEEETAQKKLEAKKMITVMCPDCGKDFEKSEDGKMMVCTSCGKKIDMKTFSEMSMRKILEAMERMKQK